MDRVAQRRQLRFLAKPLSPSSYASKFQGRAPSTYNILSTGISRVPAEKKSLLVAYLNASFSLFLSFSTREPRLPRSTHESLSYLRERKGEKAGLETRK